MVGTTLEQNGLVFFIGTSLSTLYLGDVTYKQSRWLPTKMVLRLLGRPLCPIIYLFSDSSSVTFLACFGSTFWGLETP